MQGVQTEWYPELVYMVVNNAFRLLVCMGVSFHVMSSTLHVRNIRAMLSIVIARGSVLTLGFCLVLKYFFETNAIYTFLYGLQSIIMPVLVTWAIKQCIDDSYPKLFMVALVSDYMGLGSFAAISVITKLTTGDFLSIDTGKRRDEEIIICIIFMAIIHSLIRMVNRKYGLMERFKNHEPKRPAFWTGFYAVALVFGSVSYWAGGLTGRDKGMYFVYLLCVVAMCLVVLLYFIYQRARQKRLYIENRNLLLQQNLLIEYHSSLSEQIELTGKMRHDIENHMRTLEELAKLTVKEERMEKYAASLKESYQKLERMNYCQDLLVDSVIFNKVKVCRDNHIQVIVDMTQFQKGSIPDMEILGIFYNLFDNAIEASMRVEDESKRNIELYGRTLAGHIVIKMRNRMEGVVMKNGKIITSKKERAGHGMGLSIIKDIAKKRNGTVDIQIDEHVFQITVCMDSE